MTVPAPSTLFDEVVRTCAARGMNLVGAVDAGAYDATQPCGRRAGERLPGCSTVLLLGSGGRVSWEHVTRAHGGPLGRPRARRHPVDSWSSGVAGEVEGLLRAAGSRAVTVAADDDRPLNFRQLAELVGFGTISPVIGQLLHPVYGPWVSLRVALLIEGRPLGARPPAPLVDFQPCCGCSQPCGRACPASVYRDENRPDLEHCAHWRVDGGCGDGCATLRACPIGSDHRYGAEEEAFRHAYSMFRIRRWVGAGGWRFVPGFVRRRL